MVSLTGVGGVTVEGWVDVTDVRMADVELTLSALTIIT